MGQHACEIRNGCTIEAHIALLLVCKLYWNVNSFVDSPNFSGFTSSRYFIMPVGTVSVEQVNVAIRWNFSLLKESSGASNLCSLCSEPIVQPPGGASVSQLASDSTLPVLEVAVHTTCGSRYHGECLTKYRRHVDDPEALCAMCGAGKSGFVVIPNILDYTSMDEVKK
jgi:hypothetical protein